MNNRSSPPYCFRVSDLPMVCWAGPIPFPEAGVAFGSALLSLFIIVQLGVFFIVLGPFSCPLNGQDLE